MQLDTSREGLLSFYRGLQDIFKPEALQNFEAVESFHQSLAYQRKIRLENDRLKLETDRQRLYEDLNQVKIKREEVYRYLNDHHALEEYRAVTRQLSAMEEDVQRLDEFLRADRQIQDESIELKFMMNDDDRSASHYLESEPLGWADSRFRALIRKLYPNEAAGITLRNNTRANKLRYDLNVLVQGQGSDGINAARILCFDWMVFMQGSHHVMGHLWHDNGLFDHIDPHQRAAWIRLINDELAENTKQYIGTINTENYQSTRDLLAPAERQILDEKVILRLRGDQDEHKLLGIRIGSDGR